MAPSFLIIGAQKAGTTWLYQNLQHHPQVWMPREKELHYFDERIRIRSSILSAFWSNRLENKRLRRKFIRRLRSYRERFSVKDLLWDLDYFLLPPGDRWYSSLFWPGRGRITGEATPDYSMLGRDEISRVHRLAPEAKIIFMIRNPIERNWSQATMHFGWIKGRPLETVAIEEFIQYFESRSAEFRSRVDYLRTLENWSAFYPEERIFVGFLEDMHFHPGLLMRRVYRFLGADLSAEYRVMRRKVHQRGIQTIPLSVASYLARTYYELLEKLDERFGGYASFWLYCAKRLIEDTPEETDIPYPFWESEMWEEWMDEYAVIPRKDSERAWLQSGRLSAMRAAV